MRKKCTKGSLEGYRLFLKNHDMKANTIAKYVRDVRKFLEFIQDEEHSIFFSSHICLSVPRELHWADGGLTAWPVRELEQLRRNARTIEFSGTVQRDAGPTLDLELENHGSRLTVALAGAAVICWEDGLLTLTLDEACGFGRTVRTAAVRRLHSLRLLVDSSSLELFLNDGEQVMTSRFYPQEPLYLRLEGEGYAELYDMNAMEMKTIQDERRP